MAGLSLSMPAELNEVYSRLGSIEAKVDLLVARDVTTDTRLGKLERFEAKTGGIATVVSIIVSACVAYIVKHF